MFYKWKECRISGSMKEPLYDHKNIKLNPDKHNEIPQNIFALSNREKWRPLIEESISDFIRPDILESIRDADYDCLYSDDSFWIDEIIEAHDGFEINMMDVLADMLPSIFKAFRAYHGTRTEDLSSFYTKGLKKLNCLEIEELAKKMFIDSADPISSGDKLRSAIETVDRRNPHAQTEGHVYFCMDETELLEDAGHYLIYGSEYLYNLGIRITSQTYTKNRLIGIGLPTIFMCDIPIDQIDRRTIREFSGIILSDVIGKLIGLEEDPFSAGTALSIKSDLSSEFIAGHWHPEKVKRPYF